MAACVCCVCAFFFGGGGDKTQCNATNYNFRIEIYDTIQLCCVRIIAILLLLMMMIVTGLVTCEIQRHIVCVCFLVFLLFFCVWPTICSLIYRWYIGIRKKNNRANHKHRVTTRTHKAKREQRLHPLLRRSISTYSTHIDNRHNCHHPWCDIIAYIHFFFFAVSA